MKKILIIIITALAVSSTALAAYAVLHNWNCKKCGTVLQSGDRPSIQGCPAGSLHNWFDLGKTGNDTYQCRNCGITVKSEKYPVSQGCPKASVHQWNKLNR